MFTRHVIPNAALKVHFSCHGKSFYYFVWQAERGGWLWDALGNSDVAATMEEAMEAARRWIRDGQ